MLGFELHKTRLVISQDEQSSKKIQHNRSTELHRKHRRVLHTPIHRPNKEQNLQIVTARQPQRIYTASGEVAQEIVKRPRKKGRAASKFLSERESVAQRKRRMTWCKFPGEEAPPFERTNDDRRVQRLELYRMRGTRKRALTGVPAHNESSDVSSKRIKQKFVARCVSEGASHVLLRTNE